MYKKGGQGKPTSCRIVQGFTTGGNRDSPFTVLIAIHVTNYVFVANSYEDVV